MTTRRALGWLVFLASSLGVAVLEGPSVHHIGATGSVVGAAILPVLGFLADLMWREALYQGWIKPKMRHPRQR